jgi:ABC-type multidrug transport system ATPase subunit
MDPVSRRFMWEIIADLSKSLSVVLTTHSKYECEALCARVGIMVNGALACIGSLEHLKQKFGRGIQIEIHTAEDRLDDVRRFMRNWFETAEEEECHSGRIKFLIPKQGKEGEGPSLGDIFTGLESHKEELGFRDYGVTGSSLESIFVNIARSMDEKQAEERAQHADKRENNQ